MSDIRVESWKDLQEAVFVDSWQPELKRHRSSYAFRGMRDASMRLDTSLMLLGGDYAGKEHHLLRNFCKFASRNFVENDTIWDWMSLGKHHGLPTRLLGWSFSPFVSMHFATDDLDQYDRDGVIWAVDYTKVHQLLPEVLRAELEDEGSGVLTIEMLSSAAGSLGDLESLSSQIYAVFLEPPSLDDRIVNQYALFSMMSSPTDLVDEWLASLASHPDFYMRIIIPPNLKQEVRDKLDQGNINERVLFPGLDGLSRWLKRHYRTRSS